MEEKKLLIVESPAKAKTIGKYLGGDFVVKSSVGHIRDLPKEANAITITPVGENEWKFTPKYVISDGKTAVVNELKAAVRNSSAIYLASDPDREGEAIAWHLKEVLERSAGKKPFHRVSYNEITKEAVLDAVANPHDIDMARVDAQQARRILDRLVGYKVSPLLWSNISCPNSKTLSAGRVQSVALRLLVERQREIDAFVPETYFIMGVEAMQSATKAKFIAKLARFDGDKPSIKDKQTADKALLDLAGASLVVDDVKVQPKRRHALPPFTTSTLQQAASSVLSFSPGRTMKLAQDLYERGLITYMRTDSVNVSELARKNAKEYIVSTFGEQYYPEKPNYFKSKSSAQEAHEAIRPTNVALSPDQSGLSEGELKLYDLVWRRFMASQMADALTSVKTVALAAEKPALAHSYIFTASATEVEFEGFLRVMRLSLKKDSLEDDDDETDEVASLPELAKGEILEAVRYLADEHLTKGPSHYSEASLIKALEENGVGRPSTYAQTIETLKMREYAKTDKKKLIPLERGILVCDWLVKKLENLFNVGYTAKMETELDKIEEDGEPMNEMLSVFYADFTQALAEANPAPETGKFETVFSLLDEVKEWKKPFKIGAKTFDDKRFVESIRKKIAEGKPMTSKQLDSLIRLAVSYSSQIPDVENRLKEAGLGAGSAAVQQQKADAELVNWTFGVMDRIGGMMENPFLKSLHDQWERGRTLSMKQFAILARSVGENAPVLADCDEIREKLSKYVPGGFPEGESDPAIPGLLQLMETVTEWREPTHKGKKVYDDKVFVESLAEQYSRRHVLTNRQVLALRRVAVSYKDQIPDFDKKAPELGLDNIPSSRDKQAKVISQSSSPKRKRTKKK